MRKPTLVADRTEVRVVVVTMDSHLGGALVRAENALRRDLAWAESDYACC